MQPYLLPYPEYFRLISAVDCFVVFDTAQYIRRGWVNRNRLPDANPRGWSYLTVPVRAAPRETPIGQMEIAGGGWSNKLRRTLELRYHRAPFYAAVAPLLEPLYAPPGGLLDLLESLLKGFSAYLGLSPRWVRASELSCEGPGLGATERVLQCCVSLGATEYWNLSGGRSLYQEKAFERQGVKLRFLEGGAVGDQRWSVLHSAFQWPPGSILEGPLPSRLSSGVPRGVVDGRL